MRLVLIALLILGSARSGAAQGFGQSFVVSPDTQRATVGDTVIMRFRVRLDERDLLFDTVPQPLGTLPPGVRILSVDKLTRSPDRIFHGQARLAFYHPGRQAVPVFMLPFMRSVKGIQRATLASDSAFIEIGSLLPAGNPPLKDIRELEPNGGPNLLALLAIVIVAGLLLAGYGARRRRAATATPPAAAAPSLPPPPTPYEAALERLTQIERERWPGRGEVPRHYEQVIDALRGYLETGEEVPARERTTEEVLWALPPHLSADDMRERLRALLHEADLVKFARLLPGLEAAAVFLDRSRALLRDWQGGTIQRQVVDAPG